MKNFILEVLVTKKTIPNFLFFQEQINSKLILLTSDELQRELLFFIDYLLSKQFANREKKRKPQFGCAKGIFILSPDFDAPLTDFNDYM